MNKVKHGYYTVIKGGIYSIDASGIRSAYTKGGDYSRAAYNRRNTVVTVMDLHAFRSFGWLKY